MSNSFVVESLVELRVLQRVFREAKFCTEPDDDEISESPIVANLYEKLINILMLRDIEATGDVARQKWMSWLSIDQDRDEWSAGLKRAKLCSCWMKFSEEERLNYVKTLMSPFILSEFNLKKFIADVDQLRKGGVYRNEST